MNSVIKIYIMPEYVQHILNQQSLRSDAVKEIVSSRPGVFIRRSIPFFFCLVGAAFIACWFIQYPEIIPARAKLRSVNAPKPVISKSDGKLVKLFAKEGAEAGKGELLGYIENTADLNSVLSLSRETDSLATIISNNDFDRLPGFIESARGNLGELQQSYQLFLQSFISFRDYIANGFWLKKRKMLMNDMNFLRRMHDQLLLQEKISAEDFALTQKTFTANGSLHKDKVIADFEYRNEESKLLGKKMSLPQSSLSVLGNEAQQGEKQKEILELDNKIAQQKNIFSQALNTLRSQIDEWKSKYFLTAPEAGTIRFSGLYSDNQQVRNGETICYVNPGNSDVYAELYIPQNNFGKVTIGEEVLFKFPSYPFREYGSVKGKIIFISHIPTDTGCMAKVILPAGLKTSYAEEIQYREGLTASAEIITKKRRLLQRFYYELIKKVGD